jgi:hypothetical protein
MPKKITVKEIKTVIKVDAPKNVSKKDLIIEALSKAALHWDRCPSYGIDYGKMNKIAEELMVKLGL